MAFLGLCSFLHFLSNSVVDISYETTGGLICAYCTLPFGCKDAHAGQWMVTKVGCCSYRFDGGRRYEHERTQNGGRCASLWHRTFVAPQTLIGGKRARLVP